MLPQPAAIDREFETSAVFGRAAVMRKQERPVDLLNVKASSLSAPRATIFSASSGNGRCSAFASSHGARKGGCASGGFRAVLHETGTNIAVAATKPISVGHEMIVKHRPSTIQISIEAYCGA
jgi:hypothetical protein